MSLDAIPIFVKVVEVGSFSGAARLLDLPKSTVSAKIAALEKRLQVKLVLRTTRKLRVTEAGMKYFHHCANAVRELELGESALLSTRDEPSGKLKITVPVDIGHMLLPRIVHAYLARYPGTTVEMLVSNRLVDLVGEGVDLAVRAGTMKDSSLIAKRFFSVTSNLWAAPRYLRRFRSITHPKKLAKASFVCLKGFDTLRLVNGKSQVVVPAAGRIVVDDLEVVKALAVLGEGIAWLPDFLTVDAVEAGTLVPVLPSWQLTALGNVYFVYAGRQYTSPNVQAFIQTALEVVALRA